jgi:hypothetical protein
MNRPPLARALFLAGAALILLVNALILAGAAWNRSAEEARLALTQRELPSGREWGLERERSGVSLRLDWRVTSRQFDQAQVPGYYSREVDWLDLPRLRALGFDLPDQPPARDDEARRRRLDINRRAWLVLELDGPAHAAAVDATRQHLERTEAEAGSGPARAEVEIRIKAAREALEAEREHRSRLFVIDAGTDPAALRARYPQRDRYLILGGRVGVSVQTRAAGVTIDPPRYQAHIAELEVESIHLPARLHGAVGAGGNHDAARYRIDVAWGRRHEPWVVAARAEPSN